MMFYVSLLYFLKHFAVVIDDCVLNNERLIIFRNVEQISALSLNAHIEKWLWLF